MIKIIFIPLLFVLCFAKEEIPELTKANNYYKQNKKDEAIPLYKKAALKGSAQAYFTLAYKYGRNETYNFEQAAIRGHAEALEYFLDDILFRAKSFEKVNPQKALLVYEKAKKANPNLKIYNEKEKLEVLKIAAKSKGFNTKEFIKKYKIDTKKINDESYFVWRLAEEASKNGRFGKANPKLVFDLVVRGGNVPAEYYDAVKESYKNYKKGIAHFDLCNYITSGFGQSFCANRYNQKEKIKRDKKLNKIKNTLNKEKQKLLDLAYNSATKFIEEKVSEEEAHGGTGRVAWMIQSEIEQKNEYIKLIKKISKSFSLKFKHPFSFYDKKLNEVYKKVLQKLKKNKIEYTMSNPVTKDGVQKVQKLWLKYRDNSVKLFTLLNQKSKKEDWLIFLTQKRISQLNAILDYKR